MPARQRVWAIHEIGGIKVDGNHIKIRLVRQFDVLYLHINGRLNLAESVCDLLPRGIRHILPGNLEIRGDAEQEPTAIRVQECASRLHATMKLAGSPLQLQRAGFILSYQLLNFIYGHTAKLHFTNAMVL